MIYMYLLFYKKQNDDHGDISKGEFHIENNEI